MGYSTYIYVYLTFTVQSKYNLEPPQCYIKAGYTSKDPDNLNILTSSVGLDWFQWANVNPNDPIHQFSKFSISQVPIFSW